MNDTLFHIVVHGEVILSNLPREYLGVLETATPATQVIVCPIRQIIKREKRLPLDSDSYIYLCSYDQDITKKSFSLLFSAFQMLYGAFLQKIREVKKSSLELSKSDIHRLQHNINTYNARIQDDLNSVISLEDTKMNEWRDVVRTAEKEVRKDVKRTAVVILKTIKNISLVNAEMNVYDFMENPDGEIQLANHPIHKIVKLSLQPFFLDFIENKIRFEIHECRELVRIDYPSISVVLGHLWNNAVKYTARDTEIEISFDVSNYYVDVVISSFSTVIENDEKERIMEEGYSGKWSKAMNRSGNGIGLYYMKYLTELNGGKFSIIPGEPIARYDGIPYANNKFIISLIRQR